MEIGIKVISEDIQKGIATHSNSCFFTMVAIDENKRPTPVPPRNPQSDLEKRRYNDGQRRRDIRLFGHKPL